MKLRVEYFDVRSSFDVLCGYLSFALSFDPNQLGLISVELAEEPLQVQNDIRYVLDDSWNRGELVKDSLYLD